MSLAAAGARDLVCVAGGTGLAPLKAIAEQVAFEEANSRSHRNVTLFWGARREADLYDLGDLWKLSASFPWLTIYPVISDDQGYQGLRGTVGQVAARHLPHLDCEAYIAGPAAMIRESAELLGAAGLPAERLHYDEALLSPRPRIGSST
jgi:NAD(P)H-flavin reductase